jgi:hypothetical protein
MVQALIPPHFAVGPRLAEVDLPGAVTRGL